MAHTRCVSADSSRTTAFLRSLALLTELWSPSEALWFNPAPNSLGSPPCRSRNSSFTFRASDFLTSSSGSKQPWTCQKKPPPHWLHFLLDDKNLHEIRRDRALRTDSDLSRLDDLAGHRQEHSLISSMDKLKGKQKDKQKAKQKQRETEMDKGKIQGTNKDKGKVCPLHLSYR